MNKEIRVILHMSTLPFMEVLPNHSIEQTPEGAKKLIDGFIRRCSSRSRYAAFHQS
jgi:hypothetical protein